MLAECLQNQKSVLNTKKLNKQQQQMDRSSSDNVGDGHGVESDLLLATLLQEEEYGIDLSNTEDSYKEHEEVQSTSDSAIDEECTESDFILARLLQEQEDEEEEYGIELLNTEDSYKEHEEVQSSSDSANDDEECTESDFILARLLQEQEDEAQIFLIPADSEEERAHRNNQGGKARNSTARAPNLASKYSTQKARRKTHYRRHQIGVQQRVLRYNAPERRDGLADHTSAFGRPPPSCDFENDCAICQDTLSGSQSCVSLKSCNHVFHQDCIEQACKFSSKCPTCRKSIPKRLLGKSPSGSMTVSINNGLRCGGFPNCDTIVIAYSIPAGTQKQYHESPGQYHSGKNDAAYLPNNTDGQNLLKRLKFAFLHGLTFTVGASTTTGATNQCTWSSIHHKTSPNVGVHGFPDPNYFANCNGELDSLDVPKAHELDANGKKLIG